MPGSRLVRQVLVAVALGAAVAVGLAVVANLGATLEALGRFRWPLAPLVLLAVLTNYALRFGKWHLYVRRLGIPLPGGRSVVVFLTGLTMSITPGKLGEVIKAVLVRDLTGTEVSRTAAAVMAERLTDVAGLVILAALGATGLPGGPLLVGGLAAAVVVFVLALRSRGLARLLSPLAQAHPRLARPMESLRLFVRGGRSLLAPRLLAGAVVLSAVSWSFECLALWVILDGLGTPVALRPAAVVYAFAVLAGALSMLPGGLGVAEATLTGLLVGLGTPIAGAAAATLLVRAATLWLAVGIGIMTLLLAFGGGAARSDRSV